MKIGPFEGTLSQFEELLAVHKGNYAAVAAALGVHRSLPHRAHQKAISADLAHTEVHVPNVPQSALETPPEPPVATPAELVAADKRVARLEAEVTSLRARNRLLTKKDNIVEDVAELLAPVIESSQITPGPFVGPKPSERKSLTVVAPWNDWHWGENVDGASMEGLNVYSPEIAAARVQRLVDVTGELIQDMGGRVRKLVVPILGDMFSGMHVIHPDQADEYAFVMKQGLDCALVTAMAGAELASMVDEVEFIASAGDNHTRIGRRPGTGKANQQTSLSAFYYDTVGNLLMQVPNVSMSMSRSYRASFVVEGRTWVGAHGHMMKGGGGQLGIPAYAAVRMFQSTQAKGLVKQMRMEDFDMPPVEHLILGHFHVDGLIPCTGGDMRFLPSLKGSDGFVHDVLEKDCVASQRLFVVHPKHDIIGEHKIVVQDIVDPNASSRYTWTALDEERPTGYIMRDWMN